MPRHRYLATSIVMLMAVLFLSSSLQAQIETDADVPFTEESNSDFALPDDDHPQPETSDIELVPASTVHDLNLPSPRMRFLQHRANELHRISKQGKNTLATPPAFIRDVAVHSNYNALISEDYLYHIASTHPWGRFPEGAWKRIRMVRSEGSAEKVRRINFRHSSAEYTITLSQILPEQYTLTTESALSGAGRKWNNPPTTNESNFWEESSEMKLVSFKTQDDLVLDIEGVSYSCSLEQIVFEDDAKRVEIKTWRSDASAHLPQILRRERKVFLKKPGEENSLYLSSIYQLSPTSFPYSVMGKIHHVWKCEQTDESSQGKTVITSLISLNVPGETISSDTRQYSPQGELSWQTTGYLVDYGFSCSKGRSEPIRSMFNNMRTWRKPLVLPK
ncbi:MAG: hypothetical protein IJQ39_14665 [Thermoguttaceae bacterium]|nr:hypothetical protein [Thermoguttaceae bacterium]